MAFRPRGPQGVGLGKVTVRLDKRVLEALRQKQQLAHLRDERFSQGQFIEEQLLKDQELRVLFKELQRQSR